MSTLPLVGHGEPDSTSLVSYRETKTWPTALQMSDWIVYCAFVLPIIPDQQNKHQDGFVSREGSR